VSVDRHSEWPDEEELSWHGFCSLPTEILSSFELAVRELSKRRMAVVEEQLTLEIPA
jgi:hypothetical protein